MENEWAASIKELEKVGGSGFRGGNDSCYLFVRKAKQSCRRRKAAENADRTQLLWENGPRLPERDSMLVQKQPRNLSIKVLQFVAFTGSRKSVGFT